VTGYSEIIQRGRLEEMTHSLWRAVSLTRLAFIMSALESLSPQLTDDTQRAERSDRREINMSYAPPMYRKHLWQARFPQAPDPMRYTNDERPAADSLPAGTWIFNLDENAPQWTDGTNWRDANGNIT